MLKQNYKGKCIKQQFDKHSGVCRAYNDIQNAYMHKVNSNDDVKEFQCNVILDEIPLGKFTTDFLISYYDGRVAVRECVYRKYLTKPKTIQLLDASKSYWNSRGVHDWGLVIDAEK